MELNMKKIKELAKKFLTREIILYAVFGVLTTAVNIGSFYLMLTFLHIEENLANNIAIVLSVLFAYFTNKNFVFRTKSKDFGSNFIEFCRFILGRLFTMAIESIGCALLFKYCPIPPIVSKSIMTVIVIILNFFISKSFEFKK